MVGTIGFLYILGKTLNVLSMMGLMLAAGMLVDNAVVVLESIYQKIENGMDRVTAAIVGTKEVLSAVVAATLTSIIIFVPLVFGKKTNYVDLAGRYRDVDHPRAAVLAVHFADADPARRREVLTGQTHRVRRATRPASTSFAMGT